MAFEFVDFHEQGNHRYVVGRILSQHIDGVSFPEMREHFESSSAKAGIPECAPALTQAFIKAFEDRLRTDSKFADKISKHRDILEVRPSGCLYDAFLDIVGQGSGGRVSDITTDFLKGFLQNQEKYGVQMAYNGPFG
ncbi:MAG: hypothetical protein MRY79_06655 [Alphaproteobacteria bacterium]|nr:hypothetical protein [Alphaproteobacteria bacterium]